MSEIFENRNFWLKVTEKYVVIFAAVVVSIVGFGLKLKVIVNLVRMRRTEFHFGSYLTCML